jgi:hypothetical protein
MDWAGRTSHLALMLPDITPLDIFIWGYVKDPKFLPKIYQCG